MVKKTFVKCKECRFLAGDNLTCLLGPPVYKARGNSYHGYPQSGDWVQPSTENTIGCFFGEVKD